MEETSRFSLGSLVGGPCENWPLDSPLLADGKPSRTSVGGCQLLRQYETSEGYLRVTSKNCPYEEEVSFVLLAPDLRILSRRNISAPYSSYLLNRIEWQDDQHFVAVFEGIADCWQFAIRS